MKRLFIAEKPAMGIKIAQGIGGNFKKGSGFVESDTDIVSWCVGHILEAMKPDEVDVKYKPWGFGNLPLTEEIYKTKPSDSKLDQCKVLKELIARDDVSEIINAGDPGREGQLIVDEVLIYFKNKKPVKRILLNALDVKTIKTALQNLEDNNKFVPLYKAAVARAIGDWLFGLNATRAYTIAAQKKGYRGVLNVGRVKTPTLALVVNRDKAIDTFISVPYFTIQAEFGKQDNFKAKWNVSSSTQKGMLDSENRISNKIYAEAIIQKINGKDGVIKSLEEKDGVANQPLPFSLSDLQKFASNKWGMTAQQVLDTCQSLYEKHGLQSYPRTDCNYYPENQHKDAQAILGAIAGGVSSLAQAVSGATASKKSHAFNDKELGEHHGLMPTTKVADLSVLSPIEKNIYQAVCERFVVQFYDVCKFKTTTVVINVEDEIFTASGKVFVDNGWKVIYQDEDEEKSESEDSQVFPNINQGEEIPCISGSLAAKKTSAPARYNDGSLIGDMKNIHRVVEDKAMKEMLKETKGIGQEATRTQAIEDLIKAGLLVRDGKKIISSTAAQDLIAVLPTDITSPVMTAKWETKLDKIAKSELSYKEFLEEQKVVIQSLIDEAKVLDMNIYVSDAMKAANKPKAEGTGETCPKCGTHELVKKANKAKGTTFVACSGYPACDYIKPTAGTGGGASQGKTSPNQLDEMCPDCGKFHLAKKTAKASGKSFVGCMGWPSCNYTRWK